MQINNLTNKHAITHLQSTLRLKPIVRFLARKAGYELVGQGNSLLDMLHYKLYSRKLPLPINSHAADPYFSSTTIDITTITSRVGFSYFDPGWHPFVQTLKEYIEKSNLRYEDSTLAKLYSQYRPNNIQEVLLDHLPQPVHPLCNWPPDYDLIRWIWVLNPRSIRTHLNRLSNKPCSGGWLFFGPHTNEYGRKEFKRLIQVFESIRSNGYQSVLTETDPVNGYFLKQGNQFRFVLLQGNHRVSALKVLGFKNVDVYIKKGHPAVIDRAKLHQWSEHGGGIYPSELAFHLFDTLFNESGLQKAQRYQLLRYADSIHAA